MNPDRQAFLVSEYRRIFDEFVDVLRKNVCRITFTKADGSTRILYGTRNSQIVARVSPSNLARVGALSNNDRIQQDFDKGVITVFDLQKYEFRRFSIERLHEDGFKILPNGLESVPTTEKF